MKNLDIENLERKNIFKTPESFLEEMQGKVLQQVSFGNEFDVENLERKNIFKTPEGFFENMQAKVLQGVQPVEARKEGRIVKMNWVYAAAAAITMFFGITFFVNQDKVADPLYVTENVAPENNETQPATYSEPDSKPQNEEVVALKTLEEDLTSAAPANQKISIKPMTIAATNVERTTAKKKEYVQQNPEIQVDQVLSSFTSVELADLGKNVEQDIYLDLYN